MMSDHQPSEASELYADTFHAARKAYAGLGIAVVVLWGVYLAASYGLLYAAAYLLPQFYEQWWFNWVLNLVPLYVFALPAFYLCLRRVEKGAHDPHYTSAGFVYEKPRFHIGHFALFAVISFGLMYIGNIVGTRLMEWMSGIMNYNYENSLNSLSESPWWMIMIGTVIIAPIGEEFLFRKLFIDRARRYGDGMAILLSALLFALFHGNFFQFFYAFMVGLVMAYAYTLTGKLYWSVGLHMFMNFMGMMIMPNLAKWLGLGGMESIDSNDTQAMTQFISEHSVGYAVLILLSLLIYVAMGAAVVLIIYYAKTRKIYLGSGECPLRSEDRAVAAFGNKGIFLCIFVLCLLMVMNLIPTPTT